MFLAKGKFRSYMFASLHQGMPLQKRRQRNPEAHCRRQMLDEECRQQVHCGSGLERRVA
jgi:hypothetical protein